MTITVKNNEGSNEYELEQIVNILQQFHPEQYNKAISEILILLVGDEKVKSILQTLVKEIDPSIVIE